jgi:hypothetical protein
MFRQTTLLSMNLLVEHGFSKRGVPGPGICARVQSIYGRHWAD